MEKEEYKDYFRSNMKILEFALGQWKFLGAVAVVSAILGAVFSSPTFIPPKYTSKAVIYPANLGVYSGETRLEQMMQYCESNAIRDTLIRKFDLYEEYEIDPDYKEAKNVMNYLYSEHVGYEETRFESIIVSASSTVPEKSKLMVEEFIKQLDLFIRDTERKKYKEAVDISKNLLDQKKAQIDSLENVIKNYSKKYGILNYVVQTEEVTKGYMKFLLEGKKGKDFDEVKKLYENLQEYGRLFHDINIQIDLYNQVYAERLNDYEHALKNYNKVQSHSYVLVSPEVPDKKSYPIRWLIVLLSSASATFFAFILMLNKGYKNK